RLMLKRFAKFCVALLDFLEQPHVLTGSVFSPAAKIGRDRGCSLLAPGVARQSSALFRWRRVYHGRARFRLGVLRAYFGRGFHELKSRLRETQSQAAVWCAITMRLEGTILSYLLNATRLASIYNTQQ